MNELLPQICLDKLLELRKAEKSLIVAQMAFEQTLINSSEIKKNEIKILVLRIIYHRTYYEIAKDVHLSEDRVKEIFLNLVKDN